MKINGKHIMFQAEANNIVPYEVIKATQHRITFTQKCTKFDSDETFEITNTKNRESEYHFWAETFDGARQWLLERCQNKITYLIDDLERENKYLRYIHSLVEPKITVTP